ncbi:hypothetical protein [Nocardia huaxiensis]|uniref:Uncharacterized protein n=1 Tax=Nocardia huaxiensis TaxID=2755382 RepID=A0A7D6V8I9_9NOCA|nr:hypothetical protein [Nocardia huaxiensis]QLY28931.1 hypothetical protein H0264_26885 [Nocardia huaxiensis]UFS97594.1 hypothetical protein LPY97_06715 [Nocardia huaxiensis]
MDDITYEDTRFALHAAAELLIAGPQYRRFGSIRMRIVLGGFTGVKWPVSVTGTDLVWPQGRTKLHGTYRDLAMTAGFEADGPPGGLYNDGTHMDPDEPFSLDGDAAETMHDWFAVGDTALRRFAAEQPVLWPEHFDLSVSVGEVNFGVSPGDWENPQPYAYVGPWTRRRGEYWNAPFGAMRTRAAVPTVAALVDFFREGQARALEDD